MNKLDLLVKYGTTPQQYLERCEKILEHFGSFDAMYEVDAEDLDYSAFSCPTCGTKLYLYFDARYVERGWACYQNGYLTDADADQHETYYDEPQDIEVSCETDDCPHWNDELLEQCLDTIEEQNIWQPSK